MKSFLLFFLATSLSIACIPGDYGWDCVDAEGSKETRQIDVSDFSGLSASGSHKVNVVRGSSNALSVEGHGNHLDLLDVKVKNGTLQLGFEKCIKDSDITFTVTTPELEKVVNSGSGMVFSDDRFSANSMKVTNSGSGRVNLRVDAQDLRVSNSGSGRIHLEGSGNSMTINNSGSGRIDMADYRARTAKVSFSGSGRGEIAVSDEITGAVSGSGKIRHRGNARTNVSISGSGGLERIN